MKFGTGSAIGSLTTKTIDLSKAFNVTIDVKKYGSDTGNVTVECGSQKWTITPTTDGKTEIHSFTAATASLTLVISTTSKRAYVTNIIVTYQ